MTQIGQLTYQDSQHFSHHHREFEFVGDDYILLAKVIKAIKKVNLEGFNWQVPRATYKEFLTNEDIDNFHELVNLKEADIMKIDSILVSPKIEWRVLL